jgi:hypothetical protein
MIRLERFEHADRYVRHSDARWYIVLWGSYLESTPHGMWRYVTPGIHRPLDRWYSVREVVRPGWRVVIWW